VDGSLATAWLCGIMALVTLYMGRRFAGWAIATVTGRAYETGVQWMSPHPDAGKQVPFFQLAGGAGWTEAALFLTGAALLLDVALVLVTLKRGGVSRGMLTTSLGLLLTAGLLNLGVAGYLLSQNVLPLFSVLAVAILGYVFIEQLTLLRATSHRT
jgi:hypothetical protein